MLFKEYYNLLFESYVNLIGDESIEDRMKYADQVWDVLQKAYAPVGGVKGSGFRNKEDMIHNIPFWKIYIQNGKILAVVMYKDKNGRKIVAFGTDRSPKSKHVLRDIMKNFYGNGWGEFSKVALDVLMRTIPFDIVKQYILPTDKVQQLLPSDEIISIKNWLDSGEEIRPEDARIYDKYPELIPYLYVRLIGGDPFMKVAIGTPGVGIV